MTEPAAMTRAVRGAQAGRTGQSILRQVFRRPLPLHRLPLPRFPLWARLLHQDYRRYRAAGESGLVTVFLTQGFWASVVYRTTHALVEWLPEGIARTLAKTVGGALQKGIEIVAGICVPRGCEIGGGLYIPRFGGIILSNGPIGANCTIEQSVTIGAAGKGMPAIGNRVFIGAHSIVVGKITIGDDAMICPGSFVTRSVPARAVVMGNPSKVVSYEGSFESIVYDGMEDDPERRSALERSGPPGR
jgi:serine O-acetyltransferase